MDEPHTDPLPPPLPVQPLGYSSLGPTTRPRLLTAVAVISMVLGSFSLLGALGSAASTAIMQAMPVLAPPPPPPAPATTTPAAAAPVLPNFRLGGGVLALALLDAFARAAAAALVMVAGVFVFRDHRLGRKLHVIWAWTRIPLAVLSAVVAWLTMRAMFRTMPVAPGMPPQFMDWVALASAGFQVILASIYPVAVLIVMRTRTVREFYAGLTTRTVAG